MQNGIIPAAVTVGLLTIVLIVVFVIGGGDKPKPQTEPALAQGGPVPVAPPTSAGPGSGAPTIGGGLDLPSFPPSSPPTSPAPGRDLPPIGADLTPPGPFPSPGPAPLPPITPVSVDPAPMTTPTSVAATEVPATHTVQDGDTLGTISLKYYGTSRHWKLIQAANPDLDPTSMHRGQVIKLPPPPAAPIAVQGPGASDPGAYTVVSGDTYQEISKKAFGTTRRWQEIRDLNGIEPGDLRPGQRLKLPAKTAGAPAGDPTPTPTSAPQVPPGGRTYTIGEDEYLQDIARREYGSARHWQAIAAANPGINPHRIRKGMVIVLPAKADVLGSARPATGVETPRPGAPAAPAADEYVVKSGDTGAEIAKKTLGKASRWSEIVAANPGINERSLKPGQKLRIPGRTGAPGGAGAGATPVVPLLPPAGGDGANRPTGPVLPPPPAPGQQFLDILDAPAATVRPAGSP